MDTTKDINSSNNSEVSNVLESGVSPAAAVAPTSIMVAGPSTANVQQQEQHTAVSNDETTNKLATELDEDVPKTFPQRLMDILSNEDHADVISWLPHGKGFIIYKKKKFAAEVLPLYFKQSKFTSFTRKLNRWGYTRVTRGPETGAYYHKFFRRGDLRLCMQMSCQSARPVRLPMAAAAATDLAQQNNHMIRHQLQQLQLQQLQLQQLQMQQQQQMQAAELLRQALHQQQQPAVTAASAMELKPDALFLQSLQRTKESGTGLMGSGPIALLPALQATAQATYLQQPGLEPPNGRGAWAA